MFAFAQEAHCRPREVFLGTDSDICTVGGFGSCYSIGNTDAEFVLGTEKLVLKIRFLAVNIAVQAGGKNGVVLADTTAYMHLEKKVRSLNPSCRQMVNEKLVDYNSPLWTRMHSLYPHLILVIIMLWQE
ncbi:hypothetical protein ACH5RR_032840 [Cinchona calisaya]|uniref:Uncharacterized protein n=1 Tax=Cinchona calisaya TaxID=153742 RepID=A0ABD2YKE2_9GENT